jgi:hypothetical protein
VRPLDDYDPAAVGHQRQHGESEENALQMHIII